MTDLDQKRTARSAAVLTGRATPGSKDGIPERPADEGLIHVRCSNPACGKIYPVRPEMAGKRGRCSCGTLNTISNVSAPVRSQTRSMESRPTASGDGKVLPSPQPLLNQGTQIRAVRAGCIGRGHAGKTALFRALAEDIVGDFFPSGLHVDVGDPREVARMIREGEQTQRILRKSGLPTTLEVSQIRYYLYDGDEQCVAYDMREVIGQVLTHTLPESTATQQVQYNEYLKSLVNTHVLWAVVPCPPPSPTALDRRRYANDLRITLAYLREALRLRTIKEPVAVALVLSKVDTLFEGAEEARSLLTDDLLLKSLGPLVQLIDQSARVSEAAIIPVTAFGFGNAVLGETGSEREGVEPHTDDEPFGSEPIWLLREGAVPQPDNLETLFLWSLFHGLRNQAGRDATEERSEICDLCRTLGEDLQATDPWLLPIKEGNACLRKRVRRKI